MQVIDSRDRETSGCMGNSQSLWLMWWVDVLCIKWFEQAVDGKDQ